MRSLIILEVEHNESTDGLQMFAEFCVRETDKPKWDDVDVTNYTVRVDVPECFVLDSRVGETPMQGETD